jgi:hypothetical protein
MNFQDIYYRQGHKLNMYTADSVSCYKDEKNVHNGMA